MDLVYQCPQCHRSEPDMSPRPPISPDGHDAQRRERQHKQQIKWANVQRNRAKRESKRLYEQLQSEKEATKEQTKLKEGYKEDYDEFQAKLTLKAAQITKLKSEIAQIEEELAETKEELAAEKAKKSGPSDNVQQPINVETTADVVQFVIANHMTEETVQNKVLPMMKYLGSQVVICLRREVADSDDGKVQLSKVLNAAKSALRQLLKRPQHEESLKLNLDLAWMSRMYLEVMNKATGLYEVTDPAKGRKSGGKAMICMNEEMSREDIDEAHDKLFGAQDMMWSRI